MLFRIWDCPTTTKSTLAKEAADEIAVLACEGLITTKQPGGYGRVWRLTPLGAEVIWPVIEENEQNDE